MRRDSNGVIDVLIRIFRGLAIGGVSGIALAVALELATALAGGPIGPIPGGVLRGTDSGEARPDLADVEGDPEVAIEVRGARPRSVTTWMVVHSGVVRDRRSLNTHVSPIVRARYGDEFQPMASAHSLSQCS